MSKINNPIIKNKRGETDIRCLQNMVKPITTRTCRNNCKHWDRKKKRCSIGFDDAKKT